MAPKHIETPGKSRIPAKMLPTILPSTSWLLPSLRAMQYRKTSTTVANKALMAAPRPIEDCAEMDATACPIKYANGMMDSRAAVKRNAGDVIRFSRCRMRCSTSQSKMTNMTTASRLMRKMLVPSTVYFQYFEPTARYVQSRIDESGASSARVYLTCDSNDSARGCRLRWSNKRMVTLPMGIQKTKNQQTAETRIREGEMRQ